MDELRPARRLLLFASVVTLALNVADPLLASEWGKAAFDAVGPLLLIGWAHVGPELLHALSARSPIPAAVRENRADDGQDEQGPEAAWNSSPGEIDRPHASLAETMSH